MTATPTYTTTQAIRDASGFTGNTYITNGSIDMNRARAFAQINTILGMRYVLPTLNDEDFVGSPAAQYLESIEVLLGSGLLLIDEYGRQTLDTDKDGYRKKKDAEMMLSDIRDGKVILFDKNGNTLAGIISANKPRGTIRGYVDPCDNRTSIHEKW